MTEQHSRVSRRFERESSKGAGVLGNWPGGQIWGQWQELWFWKQDWGRLWLFMGFPVEETTVSLCLRCVTTKQYLERMEAKKDQSEKARWEATRRFANRNPEIISKKDRNVEAE